MASLNSLTGAFGVIALWAVAGAVCAQEFTIDQSKLYVTDPAACQKLADEGPKAFEDMDFLSLSFKDGIQAMEFHCDFFDVKSRQGSNFIFVSAICEAPDEVYPDIMSVSPYDDNTIRVTSNYDSTLPATGEGDDADAGNPGVTLYHRCDKLSELPH